MLVASQTTGGLTGPTMRIPRPIQQILELLFGAAGFLIPFFIYFSPLDDDPWVRISQFSPAIAVSILTFWISAELQVPTYEAPLSMFFEQVCFNAGLNLLAE